ncbi:MAG: excinuclease ABC subunit UvrC [Clostridiales bacterium]|nr:excinuclease ABC subunit UvrC [Clostridiales bacterium]
MYVTDEENPRLPFLRDKTAKLTLSPGCYIMKDKNKKIIYIGKAKNLRNRVVTYFRKGTDHLTKVAKMVSLVYDYDFIVTDNEFEALVLECSLIKLHKPKYNILLKDDKGYSYIKVSNEEYPRVTRAMQKENDKAEYIGPYTSGYTVREAVDEANSVFMLPTCKKKFPQDFNKTRPCLNYHIKKCMGVCLGKVSKDEYGEIVAQAVEYIREGSQVSVEKLNRAMGRAAEDLNFEQAAKIRDRIKSIQNASARQKIFDKNLVFVDVVGLSVNGDNACASVLMYRQGRLVDKVDFFLGEAEMADEMLQDFLLQYYGNHMEVPREILLDADIPDLIMVEKFLRERAQKAVTISVPKRGSLLRLTTLAKSNASEYLSIKVGRTGKEIVALEELAKAMGLSKTPKYIECYDISNLASTNMVAGMVVFENGRPNKKFYKKFTIKTVYEQNDYACMQEVIQRRFRNYFEGTDEGFSRLPDIIFLDGGKGHVNAVQPVLDEMGINVPLFGLVKDSRHRTRAIATGGEEISVSKNRAAFALITQIQDEVHRYAITFQSQRHKKSTYQLELTTVKGIGDKKAKKLIMHYKTTQALKKASAEELKNIAGVNIDTAKQLYNVIHDIDLKE